MADYYNKNITYKGLTDSGLTVTLLDENKQKWQIWKKDFNNKEQDSEAFVALQGYKMGDTFGISYGEKPDSFTDKQTGKLVNFTRRTIYSILPVIHDSAIRTPQSTPKAESPRYEPNIASQSESREDFGKRLAIHGFLNAQITHKGLKAIDWYDIKTALELEDQVNAELAKPKGWAELGAKLKQEAEPVAPDIQESANDMEVNGDDLPF